MHIVDIELKEHSVNEREVTKIATEVAVARRQAEIVRNRCYLHFSFCLSNKIQ